SKVKTESNFSSELAFLKIRYKQPEGSKSELLTFPLKRSDVKSSFESATNDFRFATAVSAFAEKLRGSQYGTDLPYQEIAQIAAASKGDDSHGYRQEFIELVKNAQSINKQP
ncbi:MAG: DUF3520 domain-containing protein, partial [Bdellovibrionales bacterium]|nr:DUF3520 domain-containing protein [Bdellovibrionales bacterium]